MKIKAIKTLNIFLILVMMISLMGCNKTTKITKSKYRIYYVNKENTKLVNESYNLKKDDVNLMVQELLDQLKKDGKDNNKLRVIPKKVEVNKFNITDGIVTVDFNQNYSDIDNQTEVLCRAAVVLTLTQIKSIDYVVFTINDQPYTRDNGQTMGSMQASDFVDNLSGSNNKLSKSNFILYFANNEGSKLKEYILKEARYDGKSKEQFIVEQLIKGPNKEGYMPTLSSKVKLLSVTTVNNICYVKFAQNFATEQSKVSNSLVIYSIVNSLSELNDIHKVQIIINDGSTQKYHNDISIADPFLRDLDFMETETNQ